MVKITVHVSGSPESSKGSAITKIPNIPQCTLPPCSGGQTRLVRYCPAHGCSQLKRQNLRVGGYTENSLKWFNYPHARAHPGCKVRCHGTESTCIVGSSMIHRDQPDSGESCIVLQSGPTRSLVAKFPQHSVVTCSMRISCCRGRMLTTPLLALHPCRYAQNQLQTDKTLVECLISVYSSMPLTH